MADKVKLDGETENSPALEPAPLTWPYGYFSIFMFMVPHVSTKQGFCVLSFFKPISMSCIWNTVLF